MSQTESINVTILVDEAHKNNLLRVENDLKGKGFVLDEALTEIGVLIGSVPANALATLSTVPGVSVVEKQRVDYCTQH
ncbi:MAG: ketohydroxyglutarate aldolase [Planctomycetes bacterium]|nr:ketohydroxyglutarate aldolase [Planctomycetota bacterium]